MAPRQLPVLVVWLNCLWPAPAEEFISRLRMTNGCQREPIWIAHMAVGGIGPDGQNIKLEPGASFNFSTPYGLAGTRYWPKMRCDETGNNCAIGDSGGPSEVCNDLGCAPPVDTKFEASFGKSLQDEDWVDISLVDGFTLPFRFVLKGKCGAGLDEADGADVEGVEYFNIDAKWQEECDWKSGRRFWRNPEDGATTFDPPRIIDCSNLDWNHCPMDEDLGEAGQNINLKVMHPGGHDTVGCYSPCSKLTLGQWSDPGVEMHSPPDDIAAPYCCPTPPESPESCRKGPVGHTKFVEAVHRMCPGVYGYSYDDGMGLLRCPADTHYEVTFYCPSDAAGERPPLQPLRTGACTTTTTTTTVTTTSTTSTVTTITTTLPPTPAPVPVPFPLPPSAPLPAPPVEYPPTTNYPEQMYPVPTPAPLDVSVPFEATPMPTMVGEAPTSGTLWPVLPDLPQPALPTVPQPSYPPEQSPSPPPAQLAPTVRPPVVLPQPTPVPAPGGMPVRTRPTAPSSPDDQDAPAGPGWLAALRHFFDNIGRAWGGSNQADGSNKDDSGTPEAHHAAGSKRIGGALLALVVFGALAVAAALAAYCTRSALGRAGAGVPAHNSYGPMLMQGGQSSMGVGRQRTLSMASMP